MADMARQRFVLARFADFCDYRSEAIALSADPVLYLAGKLAELQGPLRLLKQDLLQDAIRAFFERAEASPVQARELEDLGHILDRLLSRSDFVDAYMHLELGAMSDPARRAAAKGFLVEAKAQDLLAEETKPAEKRTPAWETLVRELHGRLSLDVLERAVRRKPVTPRRLRFLLRRTRRNAADYCAILKVPTTPGDGMTPFMIPRVEALVAANQRFLQSFKKL